MVKITYDKCKESRIDINTFRNGYQATVISGKDERKIPLILDEYDMCLSIEKLKSIDRKIDFSFDYLYNMVAGCISICIKYKR